MYFTLESGQCWYFGTAPYKRRVIAYLFTSLLVDGYEWFGQNRDRLHVNARKGSGGI